MFLRLTFILESLLAMFSRIGLFISAFALLGSCFVERTVVVSATFVGVGEHVMSMILTGCAVFVRLPVVRRAFDKVFRRTEQYR